MDILSGASRLMVDVRRTGAGPVPQGPTQGCPALTSALRDPPGRVYEDSGTAVRIRPERVYENDRCHQIKQPEQRRRLVVVLVSSAAGNTPRRGGGQVEAGHLLLAVALALEDRIRVHLVLCWLALLSSGWPRPPRAKPGATCSTTWTSCAQASSPDPPALDILQRTETTPRQARRTGRPPAVSRHLPLLRGIESAMKHKQADSSLGGLGIHHETTRVVARLSPGNYRDLIVRGCRS